MTYEDIEKALAALDETANLLEAEYIENDGEVTGYACELEAQQAAIKELLAGDGIDTLARWMRAKEDEAKALKAEADYIIRKRKSVDNTIDFVKGKIAVVLAAIGKDSVKGRCGYSFTAYRSEKVTCDNAAVMAAYAEDVRAAIIGIVPEWVDFRLEGKASLLPLGTTDYPTPFRVDTKDTVKFLKPRASKEE